MESVGGSALPRGGEDPLSLAQGEAVRTSAPEPETYAMLLAGLGLMGFVARRRN